MLETQNKYSNKKIQKAGNFLIQKNIDFNSNEYQESTDILSYFRSQHVESLSKVSNLVYKVSKQIDSKVIVGKRLKRIPSIIDKLKRFQKMKLNRMQDIAGCRAILLTERRIRKVEKELLKQGCEVLKDYIKKPKEDGYRGIHLIKKDRKYPIEIQLRTKIQHSWATAVEIIDLFEKTNLKANIGSSEESLKNSIDWLDFFKHISSEFAILDNSRHSKREYDIDETLILIQRFNIINKFLAYTESLSVLSEHIKKHEINGYNLIRINLIESTLEIESFSDNSMATNKYLEYEREAIKDKNLIIALVSTQSFSNLEDAYPNYFADSKIFIENIKKIKYEKVKKENKLINSLLKMLFSSRHQ